MPDENAVTSYRDIKGWFAWDDRAMFDAVLDAQGGEPGVLVELGTYLGRSAVIIGDHLREGERFVVVDLFGSEDELAAGSEHAANRQENRFSYRTLTQQKFEENYLALHDRLPEVVQGLSTEIVKYVDPGTARFVHIDASHLYDQVVDDVHNARTLLRSDGVVVFDDFRSAHTPGVAAAVWEAVSQHGLVPFAVTGHKLYGVWGDPAPYLAAVRRLGSGDPRLRASEQTVMGHVIVRVWPKPTKDKAAARVTATQSAPSASAKPGAAAAKGAGSARRSAGGLRDWVPPVVARWVARRRSATR